MKAFLLAAGNGTRLRPLTNTIPKCLVPIQGTPLLGHWLEWCLRSGITDVLINTHAHAGQVRAYVDAYQGPLRITLAYEPELLGSAGTLNANRGFVEGEREFAILYGDVLTNFHFDRLLAFHRERKAPVTVGTYRVPNPTQCGILSTDEHGRVLEFVEKPEHPKSDLAFAGFIVGGPELMKQVPAQAPADIGFAVLPKLVGTMYAMPVDGYILDVGTLEKLEQAEREWPGLG